MKGYLHSQDGSYAFPLGPKVTTIGRENCDISINSPYVDNQHALIEYDNEQRCFILKDLNSASGTYVHECRVQNAAVRLADEDFLRFGFNGLPLQFRIEQQQQQQQQEMITMPSIYQRQSTSNSLHLINQTIPSRRISNHHQQPIDVQQNPGFSLRTRPLSAGSKKHPGITTFSQNSNGVRDSLVHPNAWTITNPINNNRSIISGSFSGELDIPNQDNKELTNRVDQLEKEVKSRDTQIRDLTDRLRKLEPVSSTFTNEVQTLKTELEKVKREKQAASGLVSTLKRDLSSKDSDIAKLTREIEGLKTDSRDKDLRLQSLQSKLNLVRDRNRSEDDRNNKEKELKIKSSEQQINELNETINRLKSQLQDTEKQLLKVNQNEQKLKQECEHTRGQLKQIQTNEITLKSDLTNAQKKYNQLCINIWHCFNDNDEYNEDENDIIQQIEQLKQELDQIKTNSENQFQQQLTINEQLTNLFNKFLHLITNTINQETTENILSHTKQQIIEIELNLNDNIFIGIFQKVIIHLIDNYAKFIYQINNLINQENDQKQDLSIDEILRSIRRQYEEFENVKQNYSLEQISREQTYRTQYEQLETEKDNYWEQRLNEESDKFRQEIIQLQKQYDEQSQSFSDRLEIAATQNTEYIQRWNILQTESAQKIDELTTKLEEYQQELIEQKEEQNNLININEKQNEQLIELEKEKNSIIEDLNGQVQIYKEQVQQFSITIIQLENNFKEEEEKRIKLQTDLDKFNQNVNESTTSATVETVVPVVPVLTAPLADLSQELFTYKSRVQEQEQIIISLRRDLIGMTARLSDIQGELTEKQKQILEKNELTIREQTKELNETRLKLSKLSDIIDQQSTQIQILQTDLTKSKNLTDQYQLLVDQRQSDIDRLTKSLEEKSVVIERVEKTNQDEGRISNEFVAIGAQCKGERHEQTISRQREALNELRGRIRTLEQLRPANPSYEKVLQQVVLLKRELAELRSRQALPTDIPYLTTTTTPGSNNLNPQSRKQSSSSSSPSGTIHSEQLSQTQKILEERTAHAQTINSLQNFDELHNAFTRKLIKLLDIDDDTLLNVTPLSMDPDVALQQRQRTTEILTQKIEMLRERLTRKEDLLRDYEKDLGKLRQAEILLREKEILLQDIQTNQRTKEDEALFLRNTLKETQDTLNQEKRINSSIKLGRNTEQTQSNELIRRSGANSTATPHHNSQTDSTTKIRTIKRDLNQKLTRKDYEIKTLKQELHDALDTIAEQSHQVKLLEFQSKDVKNGTNILTTHNS